MLKIKDNVDLKEEIERLNNIIDKATFERIVILMEEARDLHNIIKEVREYKNNLLYDLERGKNFEDWEEILDPIDYILDKEKNVVCICQEKLEQLEEKE